MSNLLPDSGARETYSTGAEREPRPVEKGRFDLIPPGPLLRVAVHYARGAEKYAERGWERGMPMSRTLCSLEGHINAWKAGDSGEDHLAAVVWNALALMHHEDTPGLETMRDVPTRGAGAPPAPIAPIEPRAPSAPPTLLDRARKLLAEMHKCIGSVQALSVPDADQERLVAGVVRVATSLADSLSKAAACAASGNQYQLQFVLDTRMQALPADVATAPRILRNHKQIAGLHVTNLVADCLDALQVLAEMAALYGAQKSGQGAVNEAALLQARRSPPLQMATPARLQGLSIADLRQYRGELARGMGARIVEGKEKER